ncbi:type II toxin-antitoxin system HipA family toxin [Xylophilus rhododendri]|uniref:Type II toxin-antitoxin system HipA family toxin n=1 Tax=Xylophilus rhododendri TaxID=2697032 RepID=A0A857J7I3_9BURK|nr:type II toxin-antitoxin system HipA family toxin [Xylophilus rhododendri]QHI99667.1 type II toxin-antitoxin system HipA family toxin [Xylophilus rhododendri]
MSRRSRSLGLWMNGAFVGTWSLTPEGDSLQYDPAWVASRQGRPLSLSLPFTPGNAPLRGGKVQSWFENLLPDSKAIRERIARRYRADTSEAFDLLAQIGRDCVGALQILPDGAAPQGVQTVEASPLDEADVARLLRGTLAPLSPGAADDGDELRISIAGAQEKTALLQQDGRWCLPHGSTPTSHIFKLPMGLIGGMQYDMRDSVENEWLCSLILRAYGLPVARCEPLRFEGLTVLAVERFDRSWAQNPDGSPLLLRLPQEDMCQATGMPPWLKYEADGGPGMDALLGLLGNARSPLEDRRVFFQAQLVFWMLCATDGHAKNFSLFLRAGGSYGLTPLYDVLSAYPILGEGPGRLSSHKARMAMAVRCRNAHWKMREILRRHWQALGERHGVVTPEGGGTEQVMAELLARTPEVVRQVRAQLPADFPEALADSILSGLQAAADRLGS